MKAEAACALCGVWMIVVNALAQAQQQRGKMVVLHFKPLCGSHPSQQVGQEATVLTGEPSEALDVPSVRHLESASILHPLHGEKEQHRGIIEFDQRVR